MSATATADHGGHAVSELPPEKYFGAASAGKVGMWIFLLSDAFSFGGLLLGYGILRGGAQTWIQKGEPQAFGIAFTAALTFLLICSSLSMVFAVGAAQEGDRKAATKWLWVTALGGFLFLCGQYQEYFGIIGHGLISEGLIFGNSHRASTFYVTTSFHGLHVLSGTIYIVVTALRSGAGKADANEIEILGLFWHFVDLVWILVFTFIYLL